MRALQKVMSTVTLHMYVLNTTQHRHKTSSDKWAYSILSKINTDLAQCSTSVPTVCCDKMVVNDIWFHQWAMTEFPTDDMQDVFSITSMTCYQGS